MLNLRGCTPYPYSRHSLLPRLLLRPLHLAMEMESNDVAGDEKILLLLYKLYQSVKVCSFIALFTKSYTSQVIRRITGSLPTIRVPYKRLG